MQILPNAFLEQQSKSHSNVNHHGRGHPYLGNFARKRSENAWNKSRTSLVGTTNRKQSCKALSTSSCRACLAQSSLDSYNGHQCRFVKPQAKPGLCPWEGYGGLALGNQPLLEALGSPTQDTSTCSEMCLSSHREAPLSVETAVAGPLMARLLYKQTLADETKRP